MTKTIYLFEILLVVFILSCSNTSVEYDKPYADGKLLVESYIKEGDTAIWVRLETPLSIYTRSQYKIDTSSRVHDATVKVFIDEAEYLLFEDHSTSINWYGYVMNSSTLYYFKKNISEFSNCRITVDYAGNKYDASAVNPGKVHIIFAEAKFNTLLKYSYSHFPLDVKCSIDCNNKKNNYFRVNARAYITYNGKKGWIDYSYSYLTINENVKNDIILTLHNDGGNYNYNDLKETEIILTNVIIYIEKLSEDYYHLREALNAQREDDDTPFGSEVIEIPSNINNGFGIFTCISRDSICANIKE